MGSQSTRVVGADDNYRFNILHWI